MDDDALAAFSLEGRNDTPVRLGLLGGFGLSIGGEPVTLPVGSQRLLALLALEDAPVRRDRVAGVLWANLDDQSSHACLRSALWRLRRLCPQSVRTDASVVRLERDVEIDIREAKDLAGRLLDGAASPHSDDATYGSVVVLSSDLLPDWYDDWAIVEGECWHQVRLHALEALSQRLIDRRAYGLAMLAAQQAVRAEPLRESAHAAVIAVHLAQGNRFEAQRHFVDYRRLLRGQLGVEPTAALEVAVGAPMEAVTAR